MGCRFTRHPIVSTMPSVIYLKEPVLPNPEKENSIWIEHREVASKIRFIALIAFLSLFFLTF